MVKYEYTLESGADHLNCAILARATLPLFPSMEALRAFAIDIGTAHATAYGRSSYMGVAYSESERSGRYAYGRTLNPSRASYRFIGDDGLTYVVRARPVDAA